MDVTELVDIVLVCKEMINVQTTSFIFIHL